MNLHYQVYTPEDYEYDKNKISENNIESKNGKNIIWNINIWDVCFSSSYGFPNNKKGFYGQYYLPKLMPFVEYLTNIGDINSIRICYKKINDTDYATLEELFDYTKPKDCNCMYQKRCDLCNYVENEEYKNKFNKKNIIKIFTNNNHNNFKFGGKFGFNFKFNCIDDVYNFRTHKLHMFHEANKIENIIIMLNLLEEHFLNEYPFFTFYLPENIKEFDNFIVIKDDGNCCEIIAQSKDYFYHFQKFS